MHAVPSSLRRRRPRWAVLLVAAAAATGAADTNVERFSFRSSVMEHELSTNVVPGDFCDPHSRSLAGYFGVKGSRFDASDSKQYFYWFFERRSTSLLSDSQPSAGSPREGGDDNVPFVIWLNGGPGCSSMLGLLQEHGPCLVNDDGKSTRLNPYSWTEAAHVLYLDQPAGTGYSYGGAGVDDNDEEMVAEDAYYFLQSFFRSEEGRAYKDLPLYLTGESFAGHYIPAVANRIWEGNQHLKPDLLHLPLSGVAIGNGAIDSEEQMKWYPEMAYHNPHGIKLVDEGGYEKMKRDAKSCAKSARRCKREGDALKKKLLCQKANNCGETFYKPLEDKNVSVYDITKPCIGPLCDDMTAMATFLNRNETKQALGVPSNVTWEECTDYVGRIWSDVDKVATFAPYISKLLNNRIPVLIYSGDLDYICNFFGNRAVALKLDWEHGDDFRSSSTDDHDWNNGGGLARSSNGLSFLQVYNAGHMVPEKQPEQALDMIRQFLNGDPF